MEKKNVLSTVVLAAFATFNAGCGDDPQESCSCEADSAPTDSGVDPRSVDDDLDGVTEADGDCNDHNDAVYPGAREWSFDGTDSDCDGADMPSGGADRYAEALPLMDTDGDGAISLAEFDAACTSSAMIFGEANPGVVQTHSDCGGTNMCRGMVLHAWNQLFEHDCRGVNGCAGWSCVETAAGEDRDGATAFGAANCDWCHGGGDTFLVQVPEGEDPTAWVDGFLTRSDDAFRAAIAFGMTGISADGVAQSNMPASYLKLSRAEMDAVIAHLRTLSLAPAE